MLKSRIIYILFVLATLYVMIVFGERFSYAVFYSLILLFVFSFLTLIVSPYFIKIKEKVEKKEVFKNESLNYCAHISNIGLLPYPRIKFEFYQGDFVRYEKTQPEPVSVMSRDGVFDGYQISFPYRGVYGVGIKRFYVTDFLGLFKFGFSKKSRIQVMVYPEKIEDFTLNLRSELLSKTSSAFNVFNDNLTEVSDVRKYEPADDYKRIHWKLTAKKNEFIVKNYLSSVLNKSYVYLDTMTVPLKGESKLWFEDKMVSYAAAAVNYCLMNRYPVSLSYGPGLYDIADVESLADFYGIIRKLAEVNFNNECYLANTISNTVKDDDFYNLVFFVFDIEDDVFDAITNLSVMGHNVIVYYLCGEDMKPDFVKQNYIAVLGESGITVNMIYL